MSRHGHRRAVGLGRGVVVSLGYAYVFVLGRYIESRGNTWTTWTLE